MLIAALLIGFLVGAGLGVWLTIFALLPTSLLLGLTSFAVAQFEETRVHSAVIALAAILACQAGYVIASVVRSRFAARSQLRPERDEP